MERIKLFNKYADEYDIVFVRHIAQIYTERDDVVIRLDNGHRIYTEFESVADAEKAIDEAIGATV